jgi:ketosteroid isomerase-like protein
LTYHVAADEFSRGHPKPVKALFSQRDDVTLANPFGPAVRGLEQVSRALDYASSRFRDGKVSFERIAIYASPDLATILELERWNTKVGGSEDLAPFDLRVTSTFRREHDVRKPVHRHADPITTHDPRGPLRGA